MKDKANFKYWDLTETVWKTQLESISGGGYVFVLSTLLIGMDVCIYIYIDKIIQSMDNLPELGCSIQG